MPKLTARVIGNGIADVGAIRTSIAVSPMYERGAVDVPAFASPWARATHIPQPRAFRPNATHGHVKGMRQCIVPRDGVFSGLGVNRALLSCKSHSVTGHTIDDWTYQDSVRCPTQISPYLGPDNCRWVSGAGAQRPE